MIKIAICEDEVKIRLELKALIESYIDQYKVPAKIFLYHTAEDLEEYRMENHCDFDIIFFDIIMPGVDGLTCARNIRKQSRTVKFVFLTNCVEYVFAGYEVNASRYILKPLNQVKIFETLDHVLQEVQDLRCKNIVVKSHGKIHRIALEEIILAETSNNVIMLTCADNQDAVTLYEKLDDFLARVNYDFFIRVHKSYAVNFLYIETYKSSEIILKNSAVLPISRTYKISVRDRFFCLLHAEK